MGAGGGGADAASPALDSFTYHRGIAPTLGVLLGLAIVETAVIHIVAMALWGWRVALVLGALDLSLVVALVALLRAMPRQPVTIGEGLLTMRVGGLKSIAIPLDSVRGLRETWTREQVKGRRDVADLALASWPNVVVEIDPPLGHHRRFLSAVAHKLDDPKAFAAALERHMGRA